MNDKVLILNINDFESGYGGQATFIKNLHPHLSKEFNLKYLFVPGFFLRHHYIPLRIIYTGQVFIFLLFNRRRFRLIISHTPEASYVTSFFAIPFLHIFHGNKNPLTKSIFWYGRYFRWVFDLFEKRIIKKAAKLYTVGEYRKDAEKFFNPIDFKINKIEGSGNRKDFVFAGRLEVMKNIDSIIMNYLDLPADCKENNMLHIIGIGTQETHLKKLIEKLNIEEKVQFHGLLSNEETVKIISKSFILLMSSAYEGFPMVIAESLTVGTPVISTDVGDIKTVIRNGYNGFLLPVEYNRAEYVQRIIDILSDFNHFSENAQLSSKIFNAEEISAKFIYDCRALIRNN